MGIPKSAVEQLLKESEDHSCREAPEICVKVKAIANLPTLYGDYQAVAFWNNFDTVQANEKLGFRPDERDYDIAAHMLMSLHVKSVKLLTNNPDKLKDLQLHGIKVAERIPVVMPPNQFNKFYLETKRKKLGHILDIEQRDDLAAYPHTEN